MSTKKKGACRFQGARLNRKGHMLSVRLASLYPLWLPSKMSCRQKQTSQSPGGTGGVNWTSNHHNNPCSLMFPCSLSCWRTSSCWLGSEWPPSPLSRFLYTSTSGTSAKTPQCWREPHSAWTHASMVRIFPCIDSRKAGRDSRWKKGKRRTHGWTICIALIVSPHVSFCAA